VKDFEKQSKQHFKQMLENQDALEEGTPGNGKHFRGKGRGMPWKKMMKQLMQQFGDNNDGAFDADLFG